MAKTKLTEVDVWVVRCLLCEEDLATEEGNRPPYSVQRDHLSTHGVDYRTCEPTKDGYHSEEEIMPNGGSLTTSQSVYAEDHGKGREVMLAVRSFGQVDADSFTLEAAEDAVDVLEALQPGVDLFDRVGQLDFQASEKPQEGPEDPNEYNPTAPAPSEAPEPSQARSGQAEGVEEAVPTLVPVHLVCGGPGGGYGGYSIYAPEYKLGTTYANPDDHYESLAHLLDFIERERGIMCYAGFVEYTGAASAPQMITDDERIPVRPKEKTARKSSRPHYQTQEWYGDKEDRQSWAKTVRGEAAR